MRSSAPQETHRRIPVVSPQAGHFTTSSITRPRSPSARPGDENLSRLDRLMQSPAYALNHTRSTADEALFALLRSASDRHTDERHDEPLLQFCPTAWRRPRRSCEPGQRNPSPRILAVARTFDKPILGHKAVTLSDYREGGSSLSTYSPASPVFCTSQ